MIQVNILGLVVNLIHVKNFSRKVFKVQTKMLGHGK